MKRSIFFILIFSCFYLSCWYSFSEREKGSRSICIKPFGNLTSEPGLSEVLVKSISDELSSIFVFRDEDAADYVISGDIVEIKEIPFTYTAQETPKEMKITINCKFHIRGRKNNLSIEKEIDGWGIYPISNGSRDEAISSALKLLKDKISDIVRAFP